MKKLSHYKRKSFRTELKKEANFGGLLGNALLFSAIAGPAIAGSEYLTAKGLDKIETWKQKSGVGNKKQQMFEEMLAMNPRLKQEDSLVVRKYFDTLYKFAPTVASDPSAAAAYILQSMHYEDIGGPPQQTIQGLIKSEKDMRAYNPYGTSNPNYFLTKAKPGISKA